MPRTEMFKFPADKEIFVLQKYVQTIISIKYYSNSITFFVAHLVNSCWNRTFPSCVLRFCSSGHCQITYLSSAWVCCLQKPWNRGCKGTWSTAFQKSVETSYLVIRRKLLWNSIQMLERNWGKLICISVLL